MRPENYWPPATEMPRATRKWTPEHYPANDNRCWVPWLQDAIALLCVFAFGMLMIVGGTALGLAAYEQQHQAVVASTMDGR